MNFDHQAKRICLAGQSGSGKTTLFLQLFRKWKAKYKFCFDPDREMATKLGLTVCEHQEQMLHAVKNKYPVCFDPIAEFGGDLDSAFHFFCVWVYEISKELQGTKLFAVDEIQKRTRTGIGGCPVSLNEILDAGRREEIDFLCICNKGYNKLSDDIRSQLTDLYIFKTTEKLPLRNLLQDGVSDDELAKIKSFAVGKYLHKNL